MQRAGARVRRAALASAWLAGLVSCGPGAAPAPSASTSQPAAGASATQRADATWSAREAPSACGPPVTEIARAPEREISIAGDVGSTLGIFDASLLYPAGAARGFMAYSTVAAKDDIHTRIAASSDGGRSFQVIADANRTEPMTVEASTCPAGRCTGRVIHEVASFVEDAGDPDPARRFKLFSHRYLVVPPEELHYDIGYIALQTAPRPEGPWSEPAPVIGWRSASPFSSRGAATLASGIPPLADCVALTEPGALVSGAALDLALGCISVRAQNAPGVGPARIRIELLRSHDHARTFTHVATPLRDADAACFGVPAGRVNAAQLFSSEGRTYLMVTPDTADRGYRGCVVFPFADFEAGRVERNAAGEATVVRRFDVPDHGFTGACSYAPGASGLGYTIAALAPLSLRPFRLYASGVSAP